LEGGHTAREDDNQKREKSLCHGKSPKQIEKWEVLKSLKSNTQTVAASPIWGKSGIPAL